MNTSASTTAIKSGASLKSTLAFQRLCWKEARQIAPLAIVLLAINLVLHLLLADKRSGHQFHLLLLQLIPCLFAIGAGALLVSQEKEQRTIGWLSSLPIASSQILRVKMFVSLLGLAIVWLACLLLALIFDRESLLGAPSGVPFPPVLLMVINSIFLLFLGIATAWRLQSPLVALVMIVPLATLPTIFGIVAQGFSPENRISDFAIGGLYLLLSGAFLWYGWRSGQAFLTSKPQSVLWQRLLNTFERRGSRGNLLGAQPQGIASTLLWQFSVQNRMLPIAFVAIIVLPLAMYMFQKTPMTDNSIISVVAWLIASWLGASVFQSDSVHQRIKFLAERGVAPRTIWWTRQIIPFGLVLIATAIAMLLARKVMVNLYSQHISQPLMLLGLPVVLVAHAAAQWLTLLHSGSGSSFAARSCR